MSQSSWFLFQYMCGKPEQTLFSRSSSTSGTDSSIRIRKGGTSCTERRWFVCVSLAMIFTVLVASAGIYFGCKSWEQEKNMLKQSQVECQKLSPHSRSIFKNTSARNWESFQRIIHCDRWWLLASWNSRFTTQWQKSMNHMSRLVMKYFLCPFLDLEPGSFVHVEKSHFYQHKLDLLLAGSKLSPSYLHNEVFLIEG